MLQEVEIPARGQAEALHLHAHSFCQVCRSALSITIYFPENSVLSFITMEFLSDKSFSGTSGCKQSKLNGVVLVLLQGLLSNAVGYKDLVIR